MKTSTHWPVPHKPLTGPAWTLIEEERCRQIEHEGWAHEHDDAHTDAEIMRAGMSYLLEAQGKNSYGAAGLPLGWPWGDAWWKPKDARSNLIRAGALFLAEKERLLRCNPPRPIGHVDHKLRLAHAELAKVINT